MATEVQNGDAVLFGMRNDGTAITIEGYATFLLDGAKLTHKFETEFVKDELNFDAAAIATNAHKEIDLTFVPSGATRDAAETVAACPTPLVKVTLTHFALSDYNGDWMYLGDAAIDLGHGVGKMTLKLRQYDDDTQNASMTTTVAV
jgi:hypothetical protein